MKVMRVIAGSARSLRLKTVEGEGTRPTTDRIKETLFNMINDRLYDCVFIDFFSGSGGIGIEALSRGARKAYFLEKEKNCCECIRDNLKFTRLDDRAMLLQGDCKSLIGQISDKADIIFMDPPYNRDIEKEMLRLLKGSKIIDDDTLIIIEASIETSFDYVKSLGYNVIKEKEYKTNKHIFLEIV